MSSSSRLSGRVQRRLAIGAGAVVTFAASLLIAVAVRQIHFRSSVHPQLAELVAAVGTDRTIEPRLTGGFAYGSFSSPHESQPSQVVDSGTSPDVRIAAARIEKRVQVSPTSETDEALGVAQLILGKSDNAVRILEEATTKWPGDGRLWSDLSAAYLVRARRDESLEDVAKGLSSAEKATVVSPVLAEGWFNRAIALESLPLKTAARRAWENYITVDSSSKWAQEARQHLQNLSNQTQPVWDARRRQLSQATADDDALFRQIAKSSPSRTREYVEDELLPSWGEAVLAGKVSIANDRLRKAHHIADTLRDVSDDPFERDVVLALESAQGSGTLTALLKEAAIGHQAYGVGKRLYDADRFLEAARSFDDARKWLNHVKDPLWAESGIYWSYGLYTQGKAAAALRILDDIRVLADHRGYQSILGNALWLKGLIHGQQAIWTDSLLEYWAALSCFERTGEVDLQASIENLLAETFRLLGQSRQSWTFQQRALAHLDVVTVPRRRHTILVGASAACQQQGLVDAAAHFQTAVLENARVWGEPAAEISAYLGRARSHQAGGASVNPFDDVNEAKRSLARIRDGALANKFQAEVLSVEGELFLRDRPDDAVRTLTTAIDRFRETSSSTRVPGLLLTRGRAYIASGRYRLAEADLSAGIEIFEQQHYSLPVGSGRTTHFEDEWELFAEMVKFQLEQQHEPARALRFAERSRARDLWQNMANSQWVSEMSSAVDFAPFQRGLNGNAVIAYYLVLPDRLLTWLISSTDVSLFESRISAGDLASVANAHRLEMERGGVSPDARSILAKLYDELVRPLIPALPANALLIVVPDGPLHNVSFSSLLDRETGRYLAEDHPVIIGPSAAVFQWASARATEIHERPRTIMVIGNPHLDRSLFPDLPELPDAEAEAADIARLYPESQLLTQETATKKRFLEGLGTHDVVHFAGHALLNAEFPELSQLLFSRDGTQDPSGILLVRDLFGMQLSGTHLVILAACKTGVTPALHAAGAISLARPFLAAGVPSVMASLWSVDDRSSRALFAAFHRRLRADEDPVIALRAAQLDLLRGPDVTLRSPSSWAGFEVIGGTAALRREKSRGSSVSSKPM